jgi:hypothetical protein
MYLRASHYANSMCTVLRPRHDLMKTCKVVTWISFRYKFKDAFLYKILNILRTK